MARKINVGMVGYKFMGKAHSNAYRQVPMFFDPEAIPVMKVLCGRDEAWVKESAAKFGWQETETSWEKLVARDDIDLIDITAPSDAHETIAIGAARAGKSIFCEKPMALTLDGARKMLAAAEEAGVKHAINFNYRKVPAIALAKKLIADGAIGQIYHFRATYLQDWIVDPNFPLVWRLKKEVAGSGSHGDLGAHLIDTARMLVGEFDSVVGVSETFIKERPEPSRMTGLTATGSDTMGKVTVDDATAFLIRFKNGALGTIEATRFAPGHKNANHFEINGSKGSLIFDFERMNELQFFSREDPSYAQGFRTIMVTEAEHPYIAGWWPPGHVIGYEHTFVHMVLDLMNSLARNEMPSPSFYDGVKCQEVLEAVELSANEKRWVTLDELT